jgi:hypothetical protein
MAQILIWSLNFNFLDRIFVKQVLNLFLSPQTGPSWGLDNKLCLCCRFLILECEIPGDMLFRMQCNHIF